ncbi:MAG: UDP-forming cellulose synthase catalytic subunit [Deltaproteobacteria bacterium]
MQGPLNLHRPGKTLTTYKDRQPIWLFLSLPLFALLVFVAGIPVSKPTQAMVDLLLLTVLYILARFFPRKGLPRTIFLFGGAFFVLRYILWRLFFTISHDNLPSFVCSALLFAAEFYGVLMFLLNIFVNIRPIVRLPAKLPPPDECPFVDVLVPSFDEDEELLTVTLLGAKAMRYPREKLQVFLLDDGGTEAKRNQADEIETVRAEKRHQSLQKLCQRLGVTYLTRPDNANAKAGNLNAALPKTSGELILVLDADHVPTIDFLEKTVGYFLEDKRLFLVQTPHFFINPDPIEKNLGLFGNMPSENLMFYGAIHPGLDLWNASFFCGSAAVLRRKALVEVGGFSGQSITEDAETALVLHSKGWNSLYLRLPLISGLQPETFTSFIIQRMRWAQGMVQIFLLKNPLLIKGLSLPQRMCYLSSITFWFFPLSRIVFAFAPLVFLIFGLNVYNATLSELAIYTVPYLMVLLIGSDYMFGRVRWNFISQVYELMQSMFTFKAVLAVLRNPRSPRFGVTPKAKIQERDFISPLAKPFYLMIAITTLGFFFGLWRFAVFQGGRSLVAIALGWAAFNFVLYAASLGALLERRQRRLNPRLPADFKTTVKTDAQALATVFVKDISVGGANLISSRNLDGDIASGSQLFMAGVNHLTKREYSLPFKIRSRHRLQEKYVYGVSFEKKNIEQFIDIILLVHGDSSRWLKLMDSPHPDPGFWRGMLFLTRTGLIHIFKYIAIFLGSMVLRLTWLDAHRHRINKILKSVNP